ncbi:MAG TPA: hypothetical protein VK618_04150 [Flavitalea sp.]|nr:hypothetical protein [Flavitalea sp.]
MPVILFNNGAPRDISIVDIPPETLVSVSVRIIPADPVIVRIGGHSIIRCLEIDVEMLEFSDFKLGTVSDLFGKQAFFRINANKVRVSQSRASVAKIPVRSVLTVNIGNQKFETLEMDDSSNLSLNAIFNYSIKFSVR